MNSGGGQAPQLNATGISNDQTKANVGTAISQSILNNTNQKTPWGSLTYSQTGGQYDYNGNFVPQWTAEQTLNPQVQGLFDKTLGSAGTVMGQVQNAVGSPLSFDGAPGMPKDQAAAKDTAYNALMARTRTDLDRSRGGQQVLLANQGIMPGSEAYNRAMETQDRALTDASNQATLQSSNLAGQDIAQAQALRNQSINETQTLRNQPLADYQALLGLGQGTIGNNFQNTPQTQIQPTDVTGPQIAAYQGALANYQQNVANANAMNQGLMGGLFGLAGAGLGGWARSGGFGKL